MAWLMGAGFFGKAGLGAALGPIGLCVGGVALFGHAIYLANKAKRQTGDGGERPTVIQRQRTGDMDSSEAENLLHLGVVDTYANIIKNERPFNQGEDGYKYHVEADHIPPVQSLILARGQPEFPLLRLRNPNLHALLMSMETDSRGLNRLAVQVPTHHHRDALSSGNSRASTECRRLLARTMARGEAKLMLKQAFIIAHPYSSQQIRDRAGNGNRTPNRTVALTKDSTMRIYRNAFLTLINMYYSVEMIIDYDEYNDLLQYVINDMYLDGESEEYKEILDIVWRNS